MGMGQSALRYGLAEWHARSEEAPRYLTQAQADYIKEAGDQCHELKCMLRRCCADAIGGYTSQVSVQHLDDAFP